MLTHPSPSSVITVTIVFLFVCYMTNLGLTCIRLAHPFGLGLDGSLRNRTDLGSTTSQGQVKRSILICLVLFCINLSFSFLAFSYPFLSLPSPCGSFRGLQNLPGSPAELCPLLALGFETLNFTTGKTSPSPSLYPQPWLRFFSLNVHGLNSNKKRYLALEEFKQSGADIIFVHETHFDKGGSFAFASRQFPQI